MGRETFYIIIQKRSIYNFYFYFHFLSFYSFSLILFMKLLSQCMCFKISLTDKIYQLQSDFATTTKNNEK